MKKTTILGGAVAVALSLAATGAMAQDKCGLGNGKKASGDPIQIGAIVGKTATLELAPADAETRPEVFIGAHADDIPVEGHDASVNFVCTCSAIVTV